MRKLLALAFIGMAAATIAQSTEVIIHFANGSTSPDADGTRQLEAVCGTSAEERTCEIIGHSDDRGATALNDQLALERARKVAALLGEMCQDLTIGSVTGAGGREPIATNDTEAGRALNRRVVVRMRPAQAPAATATLPPLAAHAHAQVTPLMPGADKPREWHCVDATQPIEVGMSDGTLVRIPANSMVHADGRPVEGTVDLSYRGFLDPWEVVASGIPMHYGSGNGLAHFETAGMYELYASQNGEPVQMRPGTPITLETDGPEVTDEYGAYALNANTGEWELAGQLLGGETRSVPRNSRAVSEYNRTLRRLQAEPDSLTFDERQASPDYCYMSRCTPTRKPYAYDDGEFISPYAEKQIPAVHLTLDKQYSRKHKVIAFDVHSGAQRHPEMRAFDNRVRWIYQGPMDRKTFRRRVVRKHYYQDVAFHATGDASGEVRLKDRGRWSALPVELRDLNAKKDATTEKVTAAIAQYEKRLERKRRSFDRDVARNVERTNRRRDRLLLEAYTKAQRFMDSTEKAMGQQDFDQYALLAQGTTTMMNQRDNAYIYSRRPTFAMPGFGIWNCDRMVPIPLIEVPVQVLADDGKTIPWVKAYGVPARGRAVITYWNNEGKPVQPMRLSPNVERIIFVDAQRRMVVADVPGGVRNTKQRLVLKAEQLAQPSDVSMLTQMAQGF
ncbi:MAG: OmpA family protein [Flavobacteriales bacterium]|nr:OmpA family protein [Flavobacteriales bacterium]